MTNDEILISDVIDDEKSNFNNVYTQDENCEYNQAVQDSLYYTEEEYTSLLSDHNMNDKKNLKLLSLNIANIMSKLSSLKSLINNLSNTNNRPNIIVVTETHIQENHNMGDNELKNIIPGYILYHKGRNRKGGGIGIFIDKNICENRELEFESCFKDGVFEGLIITIPGQLIVQNRKKNMVILGIYRPPGNDKVDTFLTTLRDCLHSIDKNSNEVLVTGDLNLDLLRYETHTPTAEYIDIMTSHQMLPYIVRPTRIKHRSATLIDHIFMKGNRQVFSGILATELAGSHGFTDHLPVFCILNNGLTDTYKSVIERQYFTSEGHKARREGLLNQSWDDVLCENDPNIIYNIIQKRYCNHYNANITTKILKNDKNRTPKEPWMTSELLSDIRKRNKLIKQKNKRTEYKKLRNEIVKKKRKAEREYLSNKIQENWKNIRGIWNILKQTMNRMSDKTGLPATFMVDGRCISDKKENAENINNFFSQVGPSTKASIKGSQKNYKHYMKKNNPQNIHSLLTANFDENEIIDAAKSLNKKMSQDAYGVAQSILVDDIEFLAAPITHLMNCSLKEGICPDGSKLSRVIPVYKLKGQKNLYTNYRPISLIPALSKVMEKLIYDKLADFLIRYNILFKSQYGFRRMHCTSHAIMDFLKTTEHSLENDNFALGIFLDLSKAFDTLDHEVLINKLEHCGIRGKVLEWITSYLKNREQYTDFEGIESSRKPVTAGVPQGSILGPLFFLIYVNDLPAALTLLKPVMFADDTNLVIEGPNLDELKVIVDHELIELVDFFRANKLKLNIEKTKIICFRKKGKNIPRDFSIMLDGINLELVDSASFLGITLDCNLTWEKQCHEVANKISKTTGVLGRVKNFLPIPALKIVYDALIMSHIQYGLEIWGGCKSSKGKKRLVGIQKKAICHLTKSHYLSHTEPRMKQLGILKFQDQHTLQIAKLAHDIVNKQCPINLRNELDLCSESHSHSLRSGTSNPQDVRQNPPNRKKIGTSFSNLGPKIWNSIPDTIKSIKNRFSFKKRLREHIIEGYEEKVHCRNPLCRDRRSHVH